MQERKKQAYYNNLKTKRIEKENKVKPNNGDIVWRKKKRDLVLSSFKGKDREKKDRGPSSKEEYSFEEKLKIKVEEKLKIKVERNIIEEK